MTQHLIYNYMERSNRKDYIEGYITGEIDALSEVLILLLKYNLTVEEVDQHLTNINHLWLNNINEYLHKSSSKFGEGHLDRVIVQEVMSCFNQSYDYVIDFVDDSEELSYTVKFNKKTVKKYLKKILIEIKDELIKSQYNKFKLDIRKILEGIFIKFNQQLTKRGNQNEIDTNTLM